MSELLFADQLRLQEHAQLIRRKAAEVRRMQELLQAAEKLDDPLFLPVYGDLRRKTDSIAQYYRRMADCVERFSEDLAALSLQVRQCLEIEQGNREDLFSVLSRLER